MRKLFTNPLGIDPEQNSKDFEALVFPLMDRLYTTALTMTRDTFDAEDLVQDAYLKAYRFFHRFEPGTNFRAWIFHILTNTFINLYQSKKREPFRVNFETTCATFSQADTRDSDKNQNSGFIEKYEELFDDTITAALHGLPEKYRIVVLLSDVNNLKYKEIATALECPIGTVMSRLSRGRKMLARSLKNML